jgi:pimeloyl-ACP methyl ester carboxylesterase
MARRKLDSPLAPVDDLLPALGPEARAVYDFVENTEHSRATALMRRLPGVVRQDIQDLNLANYDLARISARFILVHGVDDNIIPYSESIALADALPPGQASLYLLKGLKHVDRDFESLDAWRMWRALRELLAQRD